MGNVDPLAGLFAGNDSAPISTMHRFLSKLRELVKERLGKGILTAESFDELVRQARGHTGGVARGEKYRQAQPAADGAGAEDDGLDASEARKEKEGKLNPFKLMGELVLSEDGVTGQVQVFPAVGKYAHPRYGELNVTQDFLKRIKANFDHRVYQQDLPLTIDLEHMSKLSGAAGWIKDLAIRDDKGMWATIEFNDRGKSLVNDKAYLYYSPEFYDEWADPASNKKYEDVLIGGALTNRPFFKGMAPVAVMREGTLAFVEAHEIMSGMMPNMKLMKADERVNYCEADDPSQTCSCCRFCCPDYSCCLVEGTCEANCCCALWTKQAQTFAESQTKTEDGASYPAEAYLYAPDKEKPSTWKLRIWESLDKKVTRTQLGRAAAAFSPGGFRGQKVDIPAEDRAAVLARLRGLYAQLGVKPEELPAYIKASLTEIGLSAAEASACCTEIWLEQNAGGESMGMSEEETRQMAEMRDSIKGLSGKLAEETEARKAAEAQATKASERVTALERERERGSLRQFVERHKLAFQTSVEEAVDLLEKRARLLGEEFPAYLREQELLHSQLSQSRVFDQIGGARVSGGNGTVESEMEAAVTKAMADDPKLSRPEAYAKALSENPALYNRYDRERVRVQKRGGDD